MATTVPSHRYHLRHGKLIDIDAIEHEDDAVFSDDEYFVCQASSRQAIMLLTLWVERR